MDTLYNIMLNKCFPLLHFDFSTILLLVYYIDKKISQHKVCHLTKQELSNRKSLLYRVAV